MRLMNNNENKLNSKKTAQYKLIPNTTLMYSKKFETLCREPAQISYQHRTIYSRGSSEWTHNVNSIANVWRLFATVLRECPFARNIWAMVWGRIRKCSNAASDFFSYSYEC